MKNNRTFLDKLLDGAEVKWMPLDEVANIANNARKPVKSSLRISGNIPYYGANNIQDYVEGYTHDGEFVLIAEDGSASLENYSIQWAVGKFWANNHVHVVNGKEKLNNRFLYHYLTNMNFIPFLAGKERAKLTKAKLQQIPIPIPPHPVQTEIVRILDALTALTSELTSELILRRKQYEYYREKLLSEEELGKVGFEWKTLEELVEKTQNIRWKNNTKTYRYIDLTSVDRENNNITGTIEINALNAPSRAQKIVKENDVIFATTRPTQQRMASITKEFSGEIASTGYCVLRANTDIVLPKWLFYFLSTINFKNYVEENQSGSAYPAISDSKVKEFRIPVPDVTIQQSIIEKLDKFYSLTNSLLHGLPKEINNRKKQYLYYQKELLNFKGEDL